MKHWFVRLANALVKERSGKFVEPLKEVGLLSRNSPFGIGWEAISLSMRLDISSTGAMFEFRRVVQCPGTLESCRKYVNNKRLFGSDIWLKSKI